MKDKIQEFECKECGVKIIFDPYENIIDSLNESCSIF